MKDNKQNRSPIITVFKEITNIPLLNTAKALSLRGELMHHDTAAYCYLKIQDDFIHRLFPLLIAENICLPAYFEPANNTGAHISVVYPNEHKAQTLIEDLKLGKIKRNIAFEITRLGSMELMHKTIFALTITSPTLKGIRAQYSLQDKLNYKGFLVPFHITLAVRAHPVTEAATACSNIL